MFPFLLPVVSYLTPCMLQNGFVLIAWDNAANVTNYLDLRHVSGAGSDWTIVDEPHRKIGGGCCCAWGGWRWSRVMGARVIDKFRCIRISSDLRQMIEYASSKSWELRESDQLTAGNFVILAYSEYYHMLHTWMRDGEMVPLLVPVYWGTRTFIASYDIRLRALCIRHTSTSCIKYDIRHTEYVILVLKAMFPYDIFPYLWRSWGGVSCVTCIPVVYIQTLPHIYSLQQVPTIFCFRQNAHVDELLNTHTTTPSDMEVDLSRIALSAYMHGYLWHTVTI